MKEYKIIASLSLNNFGGIVILDTTDETITSAFDFGDGLQNIKTTKVFYSGACTPYFVRYKQRYYIDDFMRV